MSDHRVYCFGVRGIPDRLPQAACDQLRMQNDLWNELVALGKEYDALYYRTLRESHEAVASLEDRVDQIVRQQQDIRSRIKQRRVKAHGEAEDKDLRDELSRLEVEKKDVRQALKKARDEAKRTLEAREQVGKQNRELKLRIKETRQRYNQMGLYWGNANPVIEKFNTARKAALKKRGNGQPADLNFHAFSGEGVLTVQLQKGLPVKDLFSHKSRQLQIEPVSEDAWDHPTRSVRRKERKTAGRIRVSSEKSHPVWLDFRVTVHRRMPEDSLVKRAQLVRRRVGNGWRWTLNVYVEEEAQGQHKLPSNEMGIDLGWRNMGDRLRVGYYGCADGTEDEIFLDESFLRTEERIQGLQSTMDKHRDAIIEAVAGWRDQGLLPDWISERVRHIRNWKSPDKLLRVVREWGENRFSGDEEMFRQANAWRTKHLHLFDWRQNLGDKMASRRREKYRIFAKWVSQNFQRVYVEDLNLQQMNRRQQVEQGVDRGYTARRQAALASCGELLRELERACAKTGAMLCTVNPAYTSRTCPVCGKKLPRQGGAREFHCEGCGMRWDRDQGAAINILERGSRKYAA